MFVLNGIIPPVTTCFNPDESLALDQLKLNLLRYLNYDLSGFLMLGSNGEAVQLSSEEKIKVLETARSIIPEDKVLLAGTGSQSTKGTILLSKEAARIGVDGVLVLNPFYYKGRMTTSALVNHYHQVADQSPVPVLIYNMPAATGIDMDADLICQIAAHPNIVGLKDSGGNLVKMSEIISRTPKDFTVLAGSAGLLYPALIMGARGGILAFANIAPQKCIDLFSLFNNGYSEEAQALQKEIIRLNNFVTRKYGISALKAAMDKLGLYGGPCRSPLLALEDDLNQILSEYLDEAGITSI